MPQSWSRQRKRLDKKSIVSSYCENKTTVYSDRALNIMRLPHPYVWDIVNAISVLKGSEKPHPYSGIRFWWLISLGAAICFIEGKLPSAHKSFRGIGEGEGSPFSKGALPLPDSLCRSPWIIIQCGCAIGSGWCFISWNFKGITDKMPQPWSPSAEKVW